jgi:nicotinate-nucleotide adenylyltransferase
MRDLSDIRRIGIMGGTFDPVHIGHLFMAETAREVLNLDKVLFIPTGYPPHKETSEVTGQQRIHMLQLAVGNNPSFQVSEMEVMRSGTTYTVDTLTELKTANPRDKFYFIIGADTLLELETWRNFEKVAGMCSFAVYHRLGFNREELEKEARKLSDAYQAEIHFIEGPHLEVSSSSIRKRLAENKTIRYLVPDDVVKYIAEHKLYKGE